MKSFIILIAFMMGPSQEIQCSNGVCQVLQRRTVEFFTFPQQNVQIRQIVYGAGSVGTVAQTQTLTFGSAGNFSFRSTSWIDTHLAEHISQMSESQKYALHDSIHSGGFTYARRPFFRRWGRRR